MYQILNERFFFLFSLPFLNCSGSAANPAPEKLTASIIGPVSKNEQTTAANLLPEKTTQLPPVAQSSRAIKLNEGWSPTLYR